MRQRIVEWLEHRTGIETAARSFLYEEIPASAGWRQVFGSMALFCFLVQAFTGALLAFNYAATPGEAYNSLRYIATELTGGSIIRGLHHWGASAMIVVVGVHMAQVFLWGAYKRPREATWLVGLALLMVTLAFGLTGYLLPWDNRAYWGTVVTTQIMGKSPGLGPYLTRLVGAEEGIGVVTFARFYALHTMLLPAAIGMLIAFHIYLVRKHGVMPSPSDNGARKRFFPEQVFKDTAAIFAIFVVLVTLAVMVQVPVDRLADPTDTSYIPRPEWYFLFLFQTLKFFDGPLEVLGSHVLPGIAMGVLALLPFLDRKVVNRMRDRVPAFVVFGLAAVTWTGLTVAAVFSTPRQEAAVTEAGEKQPWVELSPHELAGLGVYRKENCAACHPIAGKGGKLGPDLAISGKRRTRALLIPFLKNPQEVVPGTTMPPVRLPDARLNDLTAFLLKLDGGNAEAVTAAPAFATEGALVYQANSCGACHQINGVGMKLGPPLNALAKRRKQDWVVQHFADPQKLSPGTTMPPYRFSERDLERLTRYLLALP